MPKDPALPILMYKKLQKYTHKLCQEMRACEKSKDNNNNDCRFHIQSAFILCQHVKSTTVSETCNKCGTMKKTKEHQRQTVRTVKYVCVPSYTYIIYIYMIVEKHV